MQFLTPGFFDALVVIAIVIAVIAAGLRLYHDFRRGPRWQQDSRSSQPQSQLQSQPSDQLEHTEQQEKPVDD